MLNVFHKQKQIDQYLIHYTSAELKFIKMRKTLLLILLMGTMGLSSVFAQNKIEFREFTLDNGLHVIMHRDNSTPIIVTSVLYHVGSKNENPDRTGFAHFFEHLLFEGTENIDRGEFTKIVESSEIGRAHV